MIKIQQKRSKINWILNKRSKTINWDKKELENVSNAWENKNNGNDKEPYTVVFTKETIRNTTDRIQNSNKNTNLNSIRKIPANFFYSINTDILHSSEIQPEPINLSNQAETCKFKIDYSTIAPKEENFAKSINNKFNQEQKIIGKLAQD